MSRATVQPAATEHVDALINLRALLLEGSTASYACQDPALRQQWRAAYRDWLTTTLPQPGDTCVLVALRGSQVLGCVTGFVDTRAPGPDCLNGRCGWVQSLVVDPAHRGTGLSRQLMEALMSWFERRPVAKVMLQSTRAAEPLYERLGYRCSDETVWAWQPRGAAA